MSNSAVTELALTLGEGAAPLCGCKILKKDVRCIDDAPVLHDEAEVVRCLLRAGRRGVHAVTVDIG